jgi:hypothetical protein
VWQASRIGGWNGSRRGGQRTHTPSSVPFRIGGLASVSLGFPAGCGWAFEGGGLCVVLCRSPNSKGPKQTDQKEQRGMAKEIM